MVTLETVHDVLRTIDDPEMPISIVDLGIVENVSIDADTARVVVDITPTFVGCPALYVLEREIREKLAALDGVAEVTVNMVNHPPWSVDRITEAGRAALETFGVTVPLVGSDGDGTDPRPAPRCPFCHSSQTRLESPFGPTRCRMIWYCPACKNSFEHMKRV